MLVIFYLCDHFDLSLSLSQAVTLFGMWTIPFYLSIQMGFWRMLVIWTIFSVVTIFVMFKATRKKLHVNTPRHVTHIHSNYVN